jgi:hypothetical protein
MKFKLIYLLIPPMILSAVFGYVFTIVGSLVLGLGELMMFNKYTALEHFKSTFNTNIDLRDWY